MVHLQGSLMTLRFSARLNNLPVEPAKVEISDAQSRVAVLENEILKLKQELKMIYIFNRKDDKSVSCSNYEPLTEKDVNYMSSNVKEYLDFKSQNLDVLSLRHVNKLFELMRDEYQNKDQEVENRIKAKFHLVDKSSDNNNNTTSANNANTTGKNAGNDKNTGNTDKKGKNPAPEPKKADNKAGKGGKGKQFSDSKMSLIEKESERNIGRSSSSNLVNKSSLESIEDGKFPGDGMDTVNLTEAFEEFKKNAGRDTYHNILNMKKQLNQTRKQGSILANQINSLVDEINILTNKAQSYANSTGRPHGSTLDDSITVISEDEYQIRQELAEKKNSYISFKKKFDINQTQDITILDDLEDLRKKLLVEFSEDNKGSSDIYTLCTNLSVFAKDGTIGNMIVYQDEQNKPPFAIPQLNEQNDPSFNAWQGARLELATNLRTSDKRTARKFFMHT
jgi:hypothetical protein